ncbi:MAG TPA: tRNA pseudouridine(55) synthase TruB [Solirubrobacteraceae bacterium]|nr:tRNA pseudouridine(55) synthase TruB [Solirubrobacteraceae bacterium]
MDGVLLVDKPAGPTSHDIVAGVRRRLGVRRVGHAGTLDPFATGLLLALVGRATRIQRFLLALPKTYVVGARLGAVSTTGDPEGEITETGRVPDPDAPLPTGRIRQRPPAYSAVKVGGERAYRRARRGEAVEVPEREVVVHRFERLAPDRFEIECSSGTYVRSLVAGLGDAYCLELRRTRIGPFDVADADPDRVVGLDEALAFLPAVALGTDAARRAGHGQAVPGEAAGTVRLVASDGLVALADPREDGLLKPIVGFRG